MNDHPRDCPHGRQWGKCDTCDLFQAEAELRTLRKRNARLQKALDCIIDTDVDDSAAQCRIIARAALAELEGK